MASLLYCKLFYFLSKATSKVSEGSRQGFSFTWSLNSGRLHAFLPLDPIHTFFSSFSHISTSASL